MGGGGRPGAGAVWECGMELYPKTGWLRASLRAPVPQACAPTCGLACHFTAGFSAAEVFTAGVPAEALRPAGYGVPELQPATFLGPSFAPLQDSDPRLLPSPLEGTRGGIWPRMLQTQPPALTLKDAGRSGGGAGVSGGGGLGATSRLAATGMRTARAAPAASTASASPAGTGVQGLADQLPARNVGWGEAGSALPAAPGLSRTGSAAGSVRSGTLGM